jgi:Spy/CpxP family protein refolding chaperone
MNELCKGMTMKNFRKQLLIGMATLALGAGTVAAYADGADCAGMGRGHASAGDHQKFAERMKERMAKRQAELHDKLKLNASQQAAWNDYVAKMNPGERPARPDRAEFDKLSAPERMEKMLARMKDGEARMAERVDATKAFYAVLTPEQQKTFDEEFRHGPGRHGGRH